jgi:hypothetical protein
LEEDFHKGDANSVEDGSLKITVVTRRMMMMMMMMMMMKGIHT